MENKNLGQVEKKKDPLVQLADELTAFQKRFGPDGDYFLNKLIQRLRKGDAQAAVLFCNNESDKFRSHLRGTVPRIIELLYGGKGSPWPSEEKK